MEEIRRKAQHASSEVYCNCCGRKINSERNSSINLGEDYLHVEKAWGYFSNRDLTTHTFNMCEACYEKLIASFKIPIEETFEGEVQIYTEKEYQILNEAYAKEFSK